MNDEAIQQAVQEIRSIAHAQLLLQEAEALSPEASRQLLSDIVKRCDSIEPGRQVFEISADTRAFVEGVMGYCEATTEEQTGIWERFVDRRDLPVRWEQRGSIGVAIGRVDGRTVYVVLSKVIVAGGTIIFYNATSVVVDHDMVRAFIDDLMGDVLERPANHADATNFANILPREWAVENKPEGNAA